MPAAHEILIVDDETDIRLQISGILEDEGFATRLAANSTDALAAVAARQPSLVILDVWLAGSPLDGLEILKQIKEDHKDLQVIMISGHGTLDMAVNATKMGAYDFISKPFKTDELLHTIERALSELKLRRENAELRRIAGGGATQELVGNSPVMNELRKAIAKIAQTESRVLIAGPPGSGKGAVARAIHAQSPRGNGPFVVMNCASLAAETLEAVLFGREASADGPRAVGLFEEAHNGTLLLDEVADLTPELQSKMARVLHTQKFQRIGGVNSVEVSVRVLSTTARDLTREIEAGRFREDLFYRLNVVPLSVPALVERREDIPELANSLMARSAAAKGRGPRLIGDDAMSTLQGHDWAGNVWELANVMERLLLMSPGSPDEILGAAAVTHAIGETEASTSGWHHRAPEMMALPLREAREAFEKDYLIYHLNRFGGNISRTAEFVGMDRAALHRKLKGLGISGGAAGREPEEAMK